MHTRPDVVFGCSCWLDCRSESLLTAERECWPCASCSFLDPSFLLLRIGANTQAIHGNSSALPINATAILNNWNIRKSYSQYVTGSIGRERYHIAWGSILRFDFNSWYFRIGNNSPGDKTAKHSTYNALIYWNIIFYYFWTFTHF